MADKKPIWQVHCSVETRYVVQRTLANGQVETRCSASGKQSLFKTLAAAKRCMYRLNEDEAAERELRAKYARLPPLPNDSLARRIAKATGSAQ